MKTALLLMLLISLQSFGFLSSGRSRPDPQAHVVLGFLGTNPASPLQFPCLMINGEVSCDPDFIRIQNPVCQRTLHFERNLNHQFIISCLVSLSKSKILAISPVGQKAENGYLQLVLNPEVSLQSVLKPRKSGFGYFEIQLQGLK